MGNLSDKILLQTLTAQGVGTVTSGWFDLSGYVTGAIWVVQTVGGTLTLTVQMSPDNGGSFISPVPTAELAAPTGVTGVADGRFPFIGPMNQSFVRLSSAVTVSAVTAQVFFIGRAR